MSANWTLAEEIRAHWSARAATFDDEPQHRIKRGRQAALWRELLSEGFGCVDLTGRHVVDLACGTGEVSGVALDMGARVTGVDFSEPMLTRAAAKHVGRDFRGVLCDAMHLGLLEGSEADFMIARHLAWTLTEPQAAYHAWRRVLRPGGRLLVVDGDWSERGLLARPGGRRASSEHFEHRRHRDILSRLPYRQGLTRTLLAGELKQAGFSEIRRLKIWPIYFRVMLDGGWPFRGVRNLTRRFALSAG